jgi:hypothetical protein
LTIPSPSAAGITAMIVLAYGVGSGIGWMALWRRDRAMPNLAPSKEYIAEGLFALGYSIAAMLMIQVERLIIPRIFTMSDLAMFSVASALAASPFRMLASGVGFTLLPRLRACETGAQIRKLLLKEAVVVVIAVLVLIAAVWLVKPYILTVFLKNRYQLSDALVASIFAVGTVRIGAAFAVSCVQALGQSQQFRQLTICAWLSVMVSIISAYACSPFGLRGIVYGVGAGWITIALSAVVIAIRGVRYRQDLPATVKS